MIYPTLTLVAAAILVTTAAPPGTPVIDWADRNYALVQVNQEATSYEKLVTLHKSIDVGVVWNVWSGNAGDSAYVLFDDRLMWKGNASAKHALVTVEKGGRFNMYVRLCNEDGCSQSSGVPVTIADTDGAHLDPLTHVWTENNVPYTRPDNDRRQVVAAYFVEWGVYLRAFPADRVPAPNLSHLLYGFIPICGGEGINDGLKTVTGSFEALQKSCLGRDDFKVTIHDPWAALQKPQKGVSAWNDAYKGNFGQLMAIKRANPGLTVLPSIGGWTLSDPFFHFHDQAKRRTFVESVREFLLTWKFFDGVDIDWEFPGGKGANPLVGDPEQDGFTYLLLLKELRGMLDDLSLETGRVYYLTSAISAGYDKIDLVNYKDAQQYLDLIFLMSYDFKGAWSLSDLGHQTALYAPQWDSSEKYTADYAVHRLLEQRVKSDKIVLGVAMYGRGWTGVKVSAGENVFNGLADGPVAGSWEDGVVDYRDIQAQIEQGAYNYTYDIAAKAAYVYDRATGNLVSYDSVESTYDKTQYVIENNLAGVFAWEIDADNGDLLNAIHVGFGHKQTLSNKLLVHTEL